MENEVDEGFWPDSAVLSSFETWLASEGFTCDDDTWAGSRVYIERALLREIALRVWDMDTYYRVTAPHDEWIQCAISYFREVEGE